MTSLEAGPHTHGPLTYLGLVDQAKHVHTVE